MLKVAVAICAVLAVAAPAHAETGGLSMRAAHRAIAISTDGSGGGHEIRRCARKSRTEVACTIRQWGQALAFDDGTTAEQIDYEYDHVVVSRDRRGVWVVSGTFARCQIRGWRCTQG